MGVSFEQPDWLWALLAIVPFCLIALRGFSSMSRWRRLSAALARSLLTVLIVMMLAGAQSVRSTERLAVIGVIDISGSVRRFGQFAPGSDPAAAARNYFETRLERRGPDDLFGLVIFDGRAATVATPSRADVLERSLSMIPIDGSDIAGALRHAASLLPTDAAGRLVLVSDGNATGGDPVEAAMMLGSGTTNGSGTRADSRPAVPIDVIPIDYRIDDEVIIERLDAPPRAPGGSTVPLRVQIRSTGNSTGTLRLLREGEPVDLGSPGGGRRVSLKPGRHVEIFDTPLEDGRLSRFEVIYEPDLVPDDSARPDGPNRLAGDRSLDNNRAEAFTISPGESRVLLVDGVGNGAPEGSGAVLARALRRDGIGVELVAPSAMPRDLLGLQAHDLVILENVSADEMPDGAMELLVAYVRELGGGLVVVGGPDTLGAGGWRGSPLEPILPVKLNLPEKLVVPEVAIVMVLDNSGSMRRGVLGSSRSQQDVANEAAARAISSLDPGDLIGVIAFNSMPRVVVPLGPATDTDAVAKSTRAIGSGGGTNLPPALEIARQQLLEVDAKHKHIIVLSDGQSSGAETLDGIAASIHDDGIRISAIAVGDGADLQTLENIANRGNGAFYHVLNPSVLPNVFLKAVRIVRSPLVRVQPFEVAMLDTDSPLTAGLGQPPRLGGLVLTQARDEPTITYAMASPKGEPVLAHWPVELGQVAVFTSDAHDWASRWLDWDGYQTFWARTARLLSRTSGGETGELVIQRDGSRLKIIYEAISEDGAPIDLLDVPATVYGPDGETSRIRLRQTGPGWYTADTRAARGGNYIVIAKPRLGSAPLPPLLSGATVSRGDEYSRLASDRSTLESIADASGGRVLDFGNRADLFDRSPIEPRRTRTPLWPVLLVWTLVVFLLDVGTRRIAWDRLLPDHDPEIELARIAQQASGRVSALKGVRKSKKDRPPSKAKTLSDDDAEKTKRQARLKRYQAQQEELQRLRSKPASARPDRPASPTADDDSGAGEDEPTGLLAAKRRAQRRFEEDA